MTLRECECWLAEFIMGVYHQRIHSTLGVPPLVKYQQAIAAREDQPRGGRLDLAGTDPLRLRLDFMPFFERVVQPTGIHLDGIDYYHDVLRTWIAAPDHGNAALHRKFIVRRDPRDISRVYFYDPELEQYFEVPYRDRTRSVMSLWELRAARQSLREQGREHMDQDAVFDSIERLRKKQEEAAERTLRARREAQRRRLTGSTEAPGADNPSVPDVGFTDPAPEPFADIGDTFE
jgi:putative transposase